MDFVSAFSPMHKTNIGKKAKKLGVRLNPSALVLVYEEKTNTHTHVKRKKRIVPVEHFFDYKLSMKLMVLDVQADFFSDIDGLGDGQIEKMLRILQECRNGLPLIEALSVVRSEYEIQPEEDLNKLSTPLLERKKVLMQQSYLKNCVKPGDPGYVYDKQINFDDIEKQPADWDDTNEEVH